MELMRNDDWKKFVKNILLFTAPALAVFFLQLSRGVDWQQAGLVALLAFYGILADFFKKMNK